MLLNHTTFETDDAMEQFVHIQNTPKTKKQKKKKDGSKKKEKTSEATEPIEPTEIPSHEDL